MKTNGVTGLKLCSPGEKTNLYGVCGGGGHLNAQYTPLSRFKPIFSARSEFCGPGKENKDSSCDINMDLLQTDDADLQKNRFNEIQVIIY